MLVAAILVILALALTSTCTVESNPTCVHPFDSRSTVACGQLFKDVERAFVQDVENQFHIRRAFFHSPTASPVLLKVVYNVSYGENLTTAVIAEDMPMCSSLILQNSTIDLEQTEITLGWTSSGVYTLFHPTVLSVMQVRSPFTFLRIFHLTLHDQRSPEADTFLWDGSYDLPTLHLNVPITSLSCIPSQEMFESVLKDLNTLLKFYGGMDEMISIAEHAEFVGFTLPSTSVSSNFIPIGSDVILVNLYSGTLCFLYAIIICFVTVWYYKPSSAANKTINKLIDENVELTTGIRVTSSTALVVEFIARLTTCILWTLKIENSLGILFGVWMPQIHLLVMAAVQILFIGVYTCYQSEGGYQMKSQLRTFSNLCATSFTLFYLFLPTIILMFAYPTQIIVIFSFVIAYLFATTVFSASIAKLYKKFGSAAVETIDGNSVICPGGFRGKCKKHFSVLTLFISLWLVILYLHFLVFFGAYSLLIGRGAVINTGPLFLVSLFPSVTLTGGAWIVKRFVLDLNVTQQDSEDTTNEVENTMNTVICNSMNQHSHGTRGIPIIAIESRDLEKVNS